MKWISDLSCFVFHVFPLTFWTWLTLSTWQWLPVGGNGLGNCRIWYRARTVPKCPHCLLLFVPIFSWVWHFCQGLLLLALLFLFVTVDNLGWLGTSCHIGGDISCLGRSSNQPHQVMYRWGLTSGSPLGIHFPVPMIQLSSYHHTSDRCGRWCTCSPTTFVSLDRSGAVDLSCHGGSRWLMAAHHHQNQLGGRHC